MPIKRNYLFFVLLCLVVYFPLFLHLDRLPLDNFDEARLAVSALEMYGNGNWLIPHFGGDPDMYSTKPPFMIWCQVLFMKILGINELAIRLPSALAGLSTVFLLFWFSKIHLKNTLVGFFAAFILITTKGFVVKHVTRTGDYDAMLVLFMTAQVIFFWLFLETKILKKKRRYLLLLGMSIALAVLTKSIVGLMFFPAMVLFLFLRKQFVEVVTFPPTWFAIFGVITLILGYYFLREQYNPGYLQAVYENELGGRYLKALEGHKAPFLWYAERFLKIQFVPWVYLLGITVFLNLGVNFKLPPKLGLPFFASLVVFTFFLFISIAQTKLDHYDAPIYPLLSLLLAILLVKTGKKMRTRLKDTVLENRVTWVGIFVFGALFIWSYVSIVKSVYLQYPHRSSNEYAWFMKRNSEQKSYYVAVKNYNAHLEFYQQLFNQNGYQIEKTYPKNLIAGDTAMFCQGDVSKMIDGVYEYELLDENRGCFLVRILAKK